MMETKKQKYEKEITEVIEKNKITRIQHIFGYYGGIRSSQFYNLELEKSEIIKEALYKNRCKASGFLLNKWIKSDNPTLQIAAYRLVCSDDERRELNQQYTDHTTQGEKITQPQITVLSKASEEELKKIYERPDGTNSQSV